MQCLHAAQTSCMMSCTRSSWQLVMGEKTPDTTNEEMPFSRASCTASLVSSSFTVLTSIAPLYSYPPAAALHSSQNAQATTWHTAAFPTSDPFLGILMRKHSRKAAHLAACSVSFQWQLRWWVADRRRGAMHVWQAHTSAERPLGPGPHGVLGRL